MISLNALKVLSIEIDLTESISLKGVRRFSADSAHPPCAERPNFEQLDFLDSLRRTVIIPMLAFALFISNCQELNEMA